MPNPSGMPNFFQGSEPSTEHPSKGLIKPPFSPDAPTQDATPPAHLQYTHINSHAQMSPTTGPDQGGFQVPPFMLADMQRGTSSSPSTEPVVDLRRREDRYKVDSLKHVALASQNSVQRNVMAARPQSAAMPPIPGMYSSASSALASRREPVQAPAQYAAPTRPPAPARELPPPSARTKFLLMVFLLGWAISTLIGVVTT